MINEFYFFPLKFNNKHVNLPVHLLVNSNCVFDRHDSITEYEPRISIYHYNYSHTLKKRMKLLITTVR